MAEKFIIVRIKTTFNLLSDTLLASVVIYSPLSYAHFH
jgi:hypothetical protein